MALPSVLGQALSHNKAYEKVDLWKERDVQDKGSRCTISLKSRKGDVVRQVTKVPEGAEVTSNVINQFEVEREANASKKEDVLLERLANGKDPAWRPDHFLHELKGVKGKGDLTYKLRPQDYLRMDAAFVQKVVAAYKAEKKAEKKKKKKKKKKKEKKALKEGKKLKDKKEKKEKKEKKKKGQDADGKENQVKKEHHEVQEKRRSKVVLDDAGQPTCKEELEVVEVRSKVTVRTQKRVPEEEEVFVAKAKAARLASKLREKVAAQINAGGQGFQASPSTASAGPSISSEGSSGSSSEQESENSEFEGENSLQADDEEDHWVANDEASSE